VSLVQTGEGALNEMTRLLNKARSLALDSANAGVNDANAFAANQAELTNILGTIDKIATSTEFNGKKLLDGTGTSKSLSTAVAGRASAGRRAGRSTGPAGTRSA
jgi:flagellin